MTHKQETTKDQAVPSLFADPDALRELVTIMVQTLLNEEQERFLGAGHYERSGERRGHRNGTKPRTMKTRVGKLEFDLPQIRNSTEPFRTSLFDRFQRTEKALLITLQEMYVKGVSTREVSRLMEQMGGFEVSPQAVSNAAIQLDEAIAAWRTRPLEGVSYHYLIVDARYEKVRKNKRVVSQAVLIVAGVTEEGKREILGYYTGDSESEETWSEAFSDLLRRGLKGVELVVSDAHKGLVNAVRKHFQGSSWQRCRVHFKRELLNKVGWKDRPALAADLKAIYTSLEVDQCLAVAGEIAGKWPEKVSRSLLAGVEDTLAVNALELPSSHIRKLHSTNMVERLNRELKKRTRKVSIFPNEASLVRLFGAMLMETDETWQTETRRYLVMEQRES